MSELTMLSNAELVDYIRARNLKEGTEEYRLFNSLLLLSKETFARAVSALAQELILASDIRSLPAVNDRLVEALVASKLSASDLGRLEYMYRTTWFKSTVDVPALRESATGGLADYVGAILYDAVILLITPTYDPLARDEELFRNYSEAYDAYMKAANSTAALEIISTFTAAHEAFKVDYPVLASEDSGSAYDAVTSMSQRPTFLRGPALNLTTFRRSMAAFLASAVYRHVPASHLERFLIEIAYPKMAELYDDDITGTGVVAVAPLRTANPWAPVLEDLEASWKLSVVRLSRVKLPGAYNDELPDDTATELALVAYLDAARVAVLGMQQLISETMVRDPRAHIQVSGSPVGLLLLITNN